MINLELIALSKNATDLGIIIVAIYQDSILRLLYFIDQLIFP